MTDNTYTVEGGVYTFPGDNYQLRLSGVTLDRRGRIFAHAVMLTADGNAFLGMDYGEITSARFRYSLASQTAQRNSGDPLSVENFLLDATIALQSDPAIKTDVALPAFEPLDEFIANIPPKRPDVVEGLIERGNIYATASKPKVGKSLLLLNLAFAAVTGNQWLGRRVENGQVHIFQLEDSKRTLKRRIQAMTGGNLPKGIWLHTEPFRLTDENYDATVEACSKSLLVICDPIIQGTNIRDWNSPSEVRDAYEYWRRLARDTDAAVFAAVHHRKMDGEFGDAMAGSIQAQATVDGILELYRDKKLERTERRLSFTGRDWGDMDEEVIALDTETLTWKRVGTFQDAKEQAKDAERQTVMAAVRDVLPTSSPGMSKKMITDLTGLNERQVRDALDLLGDKVLCEKMPGRGGPIGYWLSGK